MIPMTKVDLMGKISNIITYAQIKVKLSLKIVMQS